MKKAIKKKTARKKRFPAAQRIKKDYEVGYGKPPKEHQFKPGQSGNPTGNTKGRTNLWLYFCQYMEMCLAELAREKRKKGLSAARRSALILVERFAKGEYTGSQRLAHYVIDREEGKPTEHVIMGNEDNVMSKEQCDEIREILRKNCEAAAYNKS